MKRIIVIIILVTIILPLFTSCKEQKNDSLTVYFYSDFPTTGLINAAIREFEAMSGITVKIEQPYSYFSEQEKELYEEKLNAEMMAGKGPDVFIAMGDFGKEIYKKMEAGIFLDLNTLIEADSSFHMEDYEEIVLDAGIYADRRYLMPLTFSVPTFLTSPDILEKYGITKDDFSSYEVFLDTALSLQQEGIMLSVNMSDVYCGWLKEVIDFENKTINTDTNTLDKVMNIKRNEYLLHKAFGDDTYFRFSEKEEDKGILFYQEFIGNELGCFIDISDDTVINMLPVPNYYGNKTAVAYQYCMISGASKNVDNAWEFVKILLGDNFQQNSYKTGFGIGVASKHIDYNIEQKGLMLIGDVSKKRIREVCSYYIDYDNAVIWQIDASKFAYYEMLDYIHSEDQPDLEKIKEDFHNEFQIWLSE